MADNYVTNIKLDSNTSIKIKDQKTSDNLESHVNNRSNPHGVTKAQIGLANVTNYDQSKAIKSITRNGTTFTATALDGTTSTFTQQDTTVAGELASHVDNKSNPHSVTKAQVGLGNVDNVSKNYILHAVYPVGSVYISASGTSPAQLFGGTWEQLKDRFLIAVGNNYTSGETGGEATHTLTTDEMPTHRHIINPEGYVQSFSIGTGYTTAVTDAYGTKAEAVTSSIGGSQPHNNMPPYLAEFMWKRIA